MSGRTRGGQSHDLRPDDTIRVLRKFRHTARYVDGARVGTLRRHAVLSLLRERRIEVLRDGRTVRLPGLKLRPPPPKPPQRRKGRRHDPWARAESWNEPDPPDTPRVGKHRACMCCGGTLWSEHYGHRLCDRCRRVSDPFW